MTAGDNLRKEITTAIRESRIFICCITLAYSNSEICEKELGYATECRKHQKNKQLIPVMFENVSIMDLGSVGAIIYGIIQIRSWKDMWRNELLNSIKK